MHFLKQQLPGVYMAVKAVCYFFIALINIGTVGPVWSVSPPPQAWGRVNMVGEIIESACAIDTASRDQTINMGSLPVSQIASNGQSVVQPFSIKLINCILSRSDKSLPDWRHFQITFDGNNELGLFGVAGTARGVALQIADSRGNVAMPGTPLPFGDLIPNEMIMNYSLRLVSNNKRLHAGEYTSTVKFKMDYY